MRVESPFRGGTALTYEHRDSTPVAMAPKKFKKRKPKNSLSRQETQIPSQPPRGGLWASFRRRQDERVVGFWKPLFWILLASIGLVDETWQSSRRQWKVSCHQSRCFKSTTAAQCRLGIDQLSTQQYPRSHHFRLGLNKRWFASSRAGDLTRKQISG